VTLGSAEPAYLVGVGADALMRAGWALWMAGILLALYLAAGDVTTGGGSMLKLVWEVSSRGA